MNIVAILIFIIIIETLVLIGCIKSLSTKNDEKIEKNIELRKVNEELDEIKKIGELLVNYNPLSANNEYYIKEKGFGKYEDRRMDSLNNQFSRDRILNKTEKLFKDDSYKSPISKAIINIVDTDSQILKEYVNEIEKDEQLVKECKTENRKLKIDIDSKNQQIEKYKENLDTILSGNQKALPYLAGVVADRETIQLEMIADSLDWGSDKKRLGEVKKIREIRKETKNAIEKAKEATYQLAYLIELYPQLEDVLDTDYQELDFSRDYLDDVDPVRKYISKEEWKTLSETERNQLALDNYIKSHSKNKWQIGRDYELYVGYQYSKQGFSVEYFGSNKGMEDLGRDLICKKGKQTRIVQCKNWSKNKEIFEKHIFQLYGTTLVYCIENRLDIDDVTPVFFTTIGLSSMAKKVAKQLGVIVNEYFEMGEYPRIKCHIGKDNDGSITKIYHLPMDQQYDRIRMDKKDSFFAFTVREAEEKGFRRAYKWYGN